MEADWEVEIGPGAPIIDAQWPGFVDLRNHPQRIDEIEEATKCPALAQALLRLNQPGSEVADASNSAAAPQILTAMWTAKCDVWELEQCDLDEMNAASDEAAVGLACYLDLLPRQGSVFEKLQDAEQWARTGVSRLRTVAAQCSRTDMVIRGAFADDQEGFGITAYISACGASAEAASQALDMALNLVADVLCC